MRPDRWVFLLTCIQAVAVVLGASSAAGGPVPTGGTRLGALDILDRGGYPRAFFFRQSESIAARRGGSYESWEATFDRLMGLEGKALDEEVVGRSVKNIEFFTRFKQGHPSQLVLLHFNGNARDPLWEADRFFAGHWVYYSGAKVLSAIPAEVGETEIAVEDARLFKVNIGRYRDRNEDIGLCELDARSRPDWSRSEQAALVSVNPKAGTIRVRRGCYGTKPRAFAAGHAYAAAHVTEGPWGQSNHLLWFYNYSTACPRDGRGRMCRDVLVDHLGELFAADGPLAAFDGVEFDVLHFRCGGARQGRGPDCDGDGQADGGTLGGLNTYGIGVVEFCRQLRARLGDDRLILADGMAEQNQRAFGLLNGIESEGWPDLRDSAIQDWSGGLNRHFFWQQNARTPVFNYINHKYRVPGDKPGETLRPAVPASTDRLVFAVAAFTDAAVCYSDAPPNGPDGLLGIWDELDMGAQDRVGWLGRPLGPAMRPATGGTELLRLGTPGIASDLLRRLAGTDVRFSIEQGILKMERTDPSAAELRCRLQDVPCNGPDLLVLVTARGAPMHGYPAEVARLMHVAAAARGAQPAASAGSMTWVNGRDFESSFSFADLASDRTDLEFTIEGPEPVWISRIAVYAQPEVMVREFEHGLVLANPSGRPYTFDLARLFPGQRFRRLTGTPSQDPRTNNGAEVESTVTLASQDALFLVR